jgi:hypothetical protein
VSDEEIERNFKFSLPDEIKAKFPNTEEFFFDLEAEYKKAVAKGKPPRDVLDMSIRLHAQMCIENSEDVYDGWILVKEIDDDILDRVKRYAHCIVKSTDNYRKWLYEDYVRRLKQEIGKAFEEE